MTSLAFDKMHLKNILLICSLILFTILAIFFREEIYLFSMMMFGRGDDSVIRSYIQSKPPFFAALFVLFQFILVLVAVFPGELLQVFIGVVYGLWWGVLICWAGVITGSMLVFFIARRAKTSFLGKKKEELRAQLSEQFLNSNRHHVILMILMYATPGITYGLVTFIAATCTKIKWYQYLAVSSAGSLFFITLTVLFGDLIVTANPMITIIITSCLFVLMVIFALNKERIVSSVFYKRKTINEKLNSFKVKEPSELLYKIIVPFFVRKIVIPKNVHINYLFDVKTLKPPFIVLGSHPSRLDYVYVIYSILPYKMNVILNRWFLQNKLMYPLLTYGGGIPKRLFAAELTVMKNIMAVVKNKGIICIFPEGINTIYGASNPVIPGTAGLLKHLKLPVVSVSINGAFLTVPKWNYNANYSGKIEVNVDLLFTPEQTEQKTTEELLSDLNEKLAYNDFKWVRENKIVYKAKKRAKGLNHLLYYCPNCKSQFKLTAHGNNIWCTECGNGAYLDNSFQLNKIKETDVFPQDITEWFKLQESVLSGEVAAEFFEIREKCKVNTFNKEGDTLYLKYTGEVIIDKSGVRFIGKNILTAKKKELFCERAKLPMVANTLNKSFDFYLAGDYYEFVLDDGIKAVRCSMAIQQIYKHYEEKK
ncbi:MAG: VTT domain-containing protein [Treponema sp.]|nr:VTT domain-containing protein [Treponema sp.]